MFENEEAIFKIHDAYWTKLFEGSVNAAEKPEQAVVATGMDIKVGPDGSASVVLLLQGDVVMTVKLPGAAGRTISMRNIYLMFPVELQA